jgi:hypothetical protein
MRLNFHRSAIGPGVLVLAVLATACGGSSPSTASSTKTAAQVLPAMQKAVKTATSVHMTGSTKSGSQTITFDLSFDGARAMSGTFSEGGGSFEMVEVGGKAYLKIDAGFLKTAGAPSSACAIVCGKFVELPGNEASQMTGTLSMSSLSSQAFGKLPAGVTKDKSELFVPGTFDGQPVLTYHGGGYTIDVSKTGTPYPVLVEDSTGDKVVFSQWNAVPAPSSPPANQVISINKL